MRLAQQMGVGACWTVGTCVPVHWLHHPSFITLCPTTAAQIYHNLLHDLHRNHHSIQHVFFSMALHALLAINVATWKNPPLPSTIIWMHVERICVQRQAVTQKTFHPIQRKKNHRNKVAEVTRTPACRKDVIAGSRRPTGFMCDIFWNNTLFRWLFQHSCENFTNSKQHDREKQCLTHHHHHHPHPWDFHVRDCFCQN